MQSDSSTCIKIWNKLSFCYSLATTSNSSIFVTSSFIRLRLLLTSLAFRSCRSSAYGLLFGRIRILAWYCAVQLRSLLLVFNLLDHCLPSVSSVRHRMATSLKWSLFCLLSQYSRNVLFSAVVLSIRVDRILPLWKFTFDPSPFSLPVTREFRHFLVATECFTDCCDSPLWFWNTFSVLIYSQDVWRNQRKRNRERSGCSWNWAYHQGKISLTLSLLPSIHLMNIVHNITYLPLNFHRALQLLLCQNLPVFYYRVQSSRHALEW